MLAGHLLPSTNNSPVLGPDFFVYMDNKDMGRPSQGLPLIDMPGRLSSLEHMMLDVSPSHMLNDARCDLPLLTSVQLLKLRDASQPWLEVEGAAAQLPPAPAGSCYLSNPEVLSYLPRRG